VSTHNINGYKGSKDFLYSICDKNPDVIRGVQEHWLAPPYKRMHGVNQLRALHSDFDGYGASAMTNHEGIRRGCPHGGTGFLYGKKYSTCLKPLLEYESQRITVMELKEDDGSIIIINVYFPHYDTSRIDQQTLEYRETLGQVEAILAANPMHQVIVLADFNANIFDKSHSFSKLISQFMESYGLVSSFE
jgi:hypothetical protein